MTIKIVDPQTGDTLEWLPTPCEGQPITRRYHARIGVTLNCGETPDGREVEIDFLVGVRGWRVVVA